MFSEYDAVRATTELSERVKKGTIGTIVMVYDRNHYEVEFIDDKGDTIELLTVEDVDIELQRPLQN